MSKLQALIIGFRVGSQAGWPRSAVYFVHYTSVDAGLG